MTNRPTQDRDMIDAERAGETNQVCIILLIALYEIEREGGGIIEKESVRENSE